jgi:hypothetical protein
MKTRFALAAGTFALAGLATPFAARAADPLLEEHEPSGWFVRADAMARFNIKAAISAVPPTISGPGAYDDGFVQPDIGGSESGRTWNWGYQSGSQINEGVLTLSRIDGVPNIGRNDVRADDPTLGGELVVGYDVIDFKVGKKPARFGFEAGYSYTTFSLDQSIAAVGTAIRTVDTFSLGGIVPPVAPYAGTPQGPGPLIGLNPSSHTTFSSPASAAFQGVLDSTLHGIRFGPWFEVSLTKRLWAGIGVGYSSVYADVSLDYRQAVVYDNPAIPTPSPVTGTVSQARWRPGAYAELRLLYQFTHQLGVFVGGDYQYNSKYTFDDQGIRVELDLGSTYSGKAGVIFSF